MPNLRGLILLAAAAAGLVPALSIPCGRQVAAAEVKLKSGIVLRGVASELESMVQNPGKKVDPDKIVNHTVLMITTPLKRYFVSRRQQPEVVKDVDLSGREVFRFKQIKKGNGLVIQSVQGFVEKPGPFDMHGRRTVTLRTASGDTPVFQGVTEITPECLRITALNFNWDTAVATTSVPLDQLDAMLKNPNVTRPNNVEDRLRIARFYIQTSFYDQAHRELDAIQRDFPSFGPDVVKVKAILAEAFAQDVLGELKLRRAAGQHQFVHDALKSFPVENVNATVLQEVREMTAEYEQALGRAERAVAQLGELQAKLKGDPRAAEIAPLRLEIAEKLNYSNLERLDAWMRLADDAQLKPDEKLALALSGWVLGSANAVTELNTALRLWQARYLLLDYLRTAHDADVERKAILKKLESLEGVGSGQFAAMLPLLPPTLDAGGAAPARTVRIAVPGAKEAPATAYWVSLPFEYHPDRAYPLIVALHSQRGVPQQEVLGFWGGPDGTGGQSQRHGYIVIAPEYTATTADKGYDYGAAAHQIVINSLRDARRRFNVDSDRVFLSGHGMGGDAAWDIGLAHPDLFAGVIPITGVIERQAKACVDNGLRLPLFAVNGGLDKTVIERNVLTLQKMMEKNFDVLYCEYRGAGPESFFSEIHTLFDWMEHQKRRPPPNEISFKTMRESDNRFFWLELAGLPESVTAAKTAGEKQAAPRPLGVSGRITPGNSINVTVRTASQRLWLPRTAGLLDFEKKVKVDLNGRTKFNDFVKPDLSALLEHVRLTGDRQQLYWAMLEFGK